MSFVMSLLLCLCLLCHRFFVGSRPGPLALDHHDHDRDHDDDDHDQDDDDYVVTT